MKFKYIVNYPKKVTAIGTTMNELQYKGVAVCAEGDVFDLNKGKKLARLRAQKKQLEYIQKSVDQQMSATLSLLDKTSRRLEKLNNQIDEINEELEKG